jgi:hydroxyethylthiazole kinase-like uncharacterized protein yjeF
MFQPALPPRNANAHKGLFGSVAVIGGDEGMVGAVLLAARAALLTGAGRVYAAMLCKDAPSVDVVQPELMLRSVSAIRQLNQLDVVVLGPGLGQSAEAIKLLEYWLLQKVCLLIDADGLNLIAQHVHLLNLIKSRATATIITPHPAEAARLLGVSASQVQQDRIASALKLAESLHASCVLKGSGSVCAHHDGMFFINGSGNAGLASAGTGDVLSGIIGGLVAQGLDAFDAVKLGVYVHGAAADALVAQGLGPVGLTASEVAKQARDIINQLNGYA